MSTFFIEQLARQHQEELLAEARRRQLIRRSRSIAAVAPATPLRRRPVPASRCEDCVQIAS